MSDRQPKSKVQKSFLTAMGCSALAAVSSMRRHLARLTTMTPAVLTSDHSSSLGESPLGETASVQIVAHLSANKWVEVLQTIQNSGCTPLHIESKPSSRLNGCSTDLSIDVLMPDEPGAQTKALRQLESMGLEVSILMPHAVNRVCPVKWTNVANDATLWYPRRPIDLDKVANNIFKMDDIHIDHPSMQDQLYLERRRMFAQLAMDYKHGQPIPLVSYTAEENGTWSIVFNRLCDLYDKHACKEFLENFKQLQEMGLYRSDRIPQLRDVSDFVKRRSGFTLRPVAGYLSARDFLSALALRVFCCTQYIRHWEKPFYTPEPDCCHELLGHVPMLADPAFAQFSQEIGLASLGATDEDVKKLATCYFFTVEFGFCKEAGEHLKVYGAGLLGCVDEFAHAVSGKATIREFDPDLVLQQECKVTTFQEMYFYTNSFAEAKNKLKAFAGTLTRKVNLVYNPYTQSVEEASASDAGQEVVQDLLGRIIWDLETALQTMRDLSL